MSLLDIAIAQPSFQNNRPRIPYGGGATFLSGNGKRFTTTSSKSFPTSEKTNKINLGLIDTPKGGIMIKAVASPEPKCLIQSSDGNKDYHTLQMGVDSTSPSVADHQPVGDSAEVDEKEKLRRMKISQANKGNIPWNRGKKHTPETLERIREKTRCAMHDPKVNVKLHKLGRARSKETRIKIGIGVRTGWERRCKKLRLQIACHLEWQNLIAEASRRGFVGEKELQWDSYKILDEQLEQEWLESVERRKKMPRPKGIKRAPKSPEQRRKISEAVAAKWADPVYRDRVYSALSKYHGKPVGVGRKRSRTTNSDRHSRKTSLGKKNGNDKGNSTGNVTKIQNKRARLKRSKMPLFKDPLVSSKLQMIENIRAHRAAAGNKKTEAIARAKLLIAEAEKAAKALEASATGSPAAQASLVETRKIIAEAIESVESIKAERNKPHDNGPPHTYTVLSNHVEKETNNNIEDLIKTDEKEVNGTQTLASSDSDMLDFGFGKFKLQDLRDGKYEIDNDKILPSSSCNRSLVNGKEELHPMGSIDYAASSSELGNMITRSSFTKQSGKLELNGSDRHQTMLPNGAKPQPGKEERPSNSTTITKKWVCGKLVEVAEGDQRLNSDSDF